MKMRHALMLALVVVIAAGFVHAIASDPAGSNEASLATAAIATAAPDSPVAAADPYLNAAEFTSEAGKMARSCSVYSSDCVFEGGPCGPVPGVCHCALHSTGFLCGGAGY
jgi:hypothetical protein